MTLSITDLMQHEIMYKPAYTLLEARLEAGERIEAESGAMVYMSPGIEIATKELKAEFSERSQGVSLEESLSSPIPFPQDQKAWSDLHQLIRETSPTTG